MFKNRLNIPDFTGKKVYIIDDEIDFCHLMAFYLKKKDCKVYYSDKAYEALKEIELIKPDIILADEEIIREEALLNLISSIAGYHPIIHGMSGNKPNNL